MTHPYFIIAPKSNSWPNFKFLYLLTSSLCGIKLLAFSFIPSQHTETSWYFIESRFIMRFNSAICIWYIYIYSPVIRIYSELAAHKTSPTQFGLVFSYCWRTIFFTQMKKHMVFIIFYLYAVLYPMWKPVVCIYVYIKSAANAAPLIQQCRNRCVLLSL